MGKGHIDQRGEGLFIIRGLGVASPYLKNPGNNFQEGCQQQQNEAANKEPPHPRSPLAFGDEREQQRDEPQQ
jgi:hypothetical protein